MIYVLIFMLSQYQKPAVGSAEFNSKEACQVAASQLYREANVSGHGASVIFASCMPKGTK